MDLDARAMDQDGDELSGTEDMHDMDLELWTRTLNHCVTLASIARISDISSKYSNEQSLCAVYTKTPGSVYYTVHLSIYMAPYGS